jgi:hypothetical protein
MRVLRYVAPGEDADHVVVETSDGEERFSLFLDVPIRDAARAEMRHVPQDRGEHPNAIGPREIQVRVRRGESPTELAEEHGMTLEKVLRFAGPVLEERARVADEARRSKARRSTNDARSVNFGDAVDGQFALSGIDPGSVIWDGRRREDGQWVVSAGWLDSGTDRQAEWLFQLVHRSVTPIDDLASGLLGDQPIRVALRAVGQDERRPALSLATEVEAAPVPDAPRPADDVFDQEAFNQPTADEPKPQPAAESPAASLRPSTPRPAPQQPAIRLATVDAPELPLPEFEPAPAPVRPAAAQNGAAAAQNGTAQNGTAHNDGALQPTTPAGELNPSSAPRTNTPVHNSPTARSARPASTKNNRSGKRPNGGQAQRTPVPRPQVTNLGVAHRGETSTTPAPGAPEHDRNARPKVPTWDDILLGVRRKQD